MSIAAQSIGETPVSGQGSARIATPTKTPTTRQVVAKADAVAQPESR